MKKSITMKQLAQLLREETAPECKKGPQQDATDLPVKKAVQEDDVTPAVPADPAAAPADPTADPTAATAPAPVDPSIVALVQQLATACGLQVTDPNAAAPAADPTAAAPAADPAAAQAVAERRARLRKLREARQRAREACRK